MSASRPLPGDRRFHACYGEVTVARSTSTLMCIVEDAAGREHLALYESLKPLPATEPAPKRAALPTPPSLTTATGMVRCPTCRQPAKVLWEAEEAGAGDSPDRSRKGWRCGCEACDCTFFLPKYPILVPFDPKKQENKKEK